MHCHLENKIALVTGAGGNLGQAVLDRFVREAAVVHGAYHGHKPDETGKVSFHQADLANEADVERVFKEVFDRHGRLDIVANVAGGFLFGPIADSPLADLEKMLSVNLRTCWLCCRQAARLMKGQGGGRIVNVASQRAVSPAAGTSCYAASKAGVVALTGALAKELAEEKITVNAILPGTIDTPANRQAMPKADFSKWTQPADIAEVMVFLVSDAASVVTGAAVPL
jgi:NAD(P)-dependent dehydrogenase (short-subunit alcohol dehydrogenase family)